MRKGFSRITCISGGPAARLTRIHPHHPCTMHEWSPEEIVSSKPTLRIWINPWKYFSATAGLSTDEAAKLMDRVSAEMESGNEDALRGFDFVSLENPYFAWKRLRHSNLPPRRRAIES